MAEQQLRILLVSNKTSQSNQLVEFLDNLQGYQVDTATNSQESLNRLALRQGQYDVALIDDLISPESNRDSPGVKLITQIKFQYPRIEFILLTKRVKKWGLKALKAGASRYLAKPVDPEELKIVLTIMAEYCQLKKTVRGKRNGAQAAEQQSYPFEDKHIHSELEGERYHAEWMVAQLFALHQITQIMQLELD